MVVAGNVGEETLRKAAEALEDGLSALADVSAVTLQGARDYQLSIEVSQATLSEYNISIDQVAAEIRNSSVNLSGGVLRTAAGDILLQTNAEAKTAEAFSDIVIISDFEGRRVLLGDIAVINDGFEEVDLLNTYNGVPAVFLQIDRSNTEDAFKVARAAKTFVAAYKPPAGINIIVASDETEAISDRINLLSRNAAMGLALVFVVLALTLDLRLAFWTSVGIPVAFLGGFILIGQFTTLNMTTLFGLIMVLGIVVDDAIVVGENIYEKEMAGHSGPDAALEGARSVLVPVMIGVLTSMAVFAPLLQAAGVLGQALQPIPIVVISVLFISLIEVFLILPAHLSHGGEWSVGAMKRLKGRVEKALYTFRDRIVLPAVSRAMRFPYVTIASCVSILIVFAGLFTGGHVRFIFFPVVEGEEIRVQLGHAGGNALCPD